MVVLFCLCLVAIAAAAGLLLDGGMAQATRRQAQAAADTAAMAALKATSSGTSATVAAESIAALNGFPASTPDCSGAIVAGVSVNNPPTTGPSAGQAGFVEVIVRRAMRTGFAAIVGQGCWMVSARAVGVANGIGGSGCTFCSINNTSSNHTLVLKNSATLRIDGEIYVNSTNGGTTPGVCSVDDKSVCGDGFDVFGAGGYISAVKISTVGGWETHDGNTAAADAITPGCEWYTPTGQATPSNVCVHMPVMVDPFNDPAKPGNIVEPPAPGNRPIAGTNGCPSYALSGPGTVTSPSKLSITNSATICPGTYFGGIRLRNNASVTMLPGVYVVIGGGFAVENNASVDGSAGVMIYNSSGNGTEVNTTEGTSEVPPPLSGQVQPKSPDLDSDDPSTDPGETVVYTFTVEKASAGPVPTGTVTFYDGDTIICDNVELVPQGDNKKADATCTQIYTNWGTRSISAIYWGDGYYAATGDAMTQTIASPSTVIAPVTILTTGVVKLSGMASGSYSGLTIFQDRTSNLVLTIQPGSSGVTCPANYMTADLSDPTGWMTGCGAMGGIRGTIYAAHKNALVFITASGLAQLQVLAGMIQVDSAANARFGFHSAFFANNRVHLTE